MSSSSPQKYTKCEITLNGFSTNPHCQHGPTVLYSRGSQQFYACSAYRSRHLCSFYADFKSHKNDLDTEGLPTRSTNHTNRKIIKKIRDLNPEDNRGQAQFYFSHDTLTLLLECLKTFQVDRILCVGVPTIHDNFSGASYLLDIDPKFNGSVSKFSHYNMCNHHFFADNTGYLNHLKDSPNLVVVCDPPFGARLELLFNTFKLIKQDWETSHEHQGKLDFIFVNPYFAEGKIVKLNANFKMSDYRVEYASHKKFKKGDKSPVRLFTTLNLSKLILPLSNYKFCSICQKYVFSNSKHCRVCASCDSRDGKNYFHCKKCKKCVKETWTHCNSCSACHLPFDENCRLTVIPSRKRKMGRSN